MADVILGAAESIAREWRVLAALWHAAAAALIIVIYSGRATNRGIAAAAAVPMFSVAGLAWWSGNPFNTTVFALAGALMLRVAHHLPAGRVAIATGRDLAAGLAMCAFGWAYPHFLDGNGWRYLYEAPLGLIPCPTLAFLIGLSLIVKSFDSRAWISIVAPLGAIYGVIGIFLLGVTIDWVLVAGAALLSAHRSAASQADREQAELFGHRRTV
jgi:hypothetical protein